MSLPISAPSLTSRLDDTVLHLATLAPAELLVVLEDEQDRLVATDDTAGRVRVGDVLPSAQLPGATWRAPSASASS